jgi:hypothetical protein
VAVAALGAAAAHPLDKVVADGAAAGLAVGRRGRGAIVDLAWEWGCVKKRSRGSAAAAGAKEVG